MRTPTFLVSMLALAVAAGVACSTVVVPDGGRASGGGSSSGQGTAPPSGTPGTPPSCALDVSGAVVLDVPDATPTAVLDSLELNVLCAFTRGDVAYTLILDMDDVDSPASYTAPRAFLERDCLADSCPGDYDFAAYAPAPTCTITLDTFAPATRGGMSGSFTCPQIPIEDFEDPEDVQAVTIDGTFAFPPPGEGEVADAGPGAGGAAGADAGPPTCTMTVSGPFDTGPMAGEGESIDGLAACAAAASGVSFLLQVSLDGPAAGGLAVDGASFCSAGCFEAYTSPAPCDVDVLDDQGVNGHFAAHMVCHGMVVAGTGTDTEEVDVIADIDGIHEPSPPPD